MIRQLYEAINSDYDKVFQRLRSKDLIHKFVLKFLEDQSYHTLIVAIKNQDWEQAFLASHTLKGVSQNLGFIGLYEASNELTEVLRQGATKIDDKLINSVIEAYEKTVCEIERYKKNQVS